MTANDKQRAEPVAWYMHLWNQADEDVKSEIRWGQPSVDDIERAEHNGHDIEHLYAGSAPAAPAMTEQNKQSDTPPPQTHVTGDNQPRYTTKRLLDEIAKARAYGLELAAQLIDANIIQDTSSGKVLAPRQDGNRDGLYYAAAIRALATTEGSAE